MVKFALDRERWGHMAFKMPWEEMEVVLQLIKDRVIDLEFKEVPVPQSEAQSFGIGDQKQKPKVAYAHHGDKRAWDNHIRSVFVEAASRGESVFYKDDRITKALAACGRKPSGATPLLSWLVKAGFLRRSGRGMYRLP